MRNCKLVSVFSEFDYSLYDVFLFIVASVLIDRRRESTDVEDLFIAHISGMDTLARGLRNVAKLIEVASLFHSSFVFLGSF